MIEYHKNPKIDAINRYFYPVAAGVETVMTETLGYLKNQGWDVNIHTSRSTLTKKNHLKEVENVMGLKIHRYNYQAYGFWPKIDINKANLILLNNFDVFPHSYLLIYYSCIKLLGRKKFILVLSPHGGFIPVWSIFHPIISFIKRSYHFTLGKMLINYVVDAIITISEWEKKEMIAKGVNSTLVTVIRNGIEKDAYKKLDKLASPLMKNKVSKFDRYIIQIGRIHPIKNYETTIKALSLVDKDVNFIIAGPELDALYKNKLISLIKELGLGNRVKFVGVVRGIDKYYLIKKAEMMVHMAIWESFCNVVHEGLSQGLVCLVANNTALPYLVKDKINGFVIETNDFIGLAKKIQYILDNKNSTLLKKIRRNNKKFTLNHTWENTSKKREGLFLRLLDRQQVN